MKIILLNILMTFALTSCQFNQQKNDPISTIDSTLQVKSTSILKNKLSEINALSGQVIIMEVQTGQIKALVGLEKRDSANYQSCENFAHAQESGLIQPISILAALETKKIYLSDKVDVGNGIYPIYGRELKDYNWQMGGYGKITLEQGLIGCSNIAIYKAMESAFGNKPQSYFDLLDKMDYGKPDSIAGLMNLKPAHFVTPKDEGWSDTAFAWLSIGYNQFTTPIQTLTFYNAIANNGKMVQPQLYKDSTIVINPQIASKANIDSLKQALTSNITDGLGNFANSDKVKIAGMQGSCQISTNEDTTRNCLNTEYAVDFCGYFPSNNPRYSIMVSINKKGLPASGGLMAGSVFKQIAEYIYY